ncbi:MAG: hypothetical protein N2515_09355, partial [Deltaproteobacteria bacterium]|nr:hypothetical protein [Deltaproteobacteria bacterium]
QKQCGEPSTEIACISTTQQGEIDQTLTPGTYYLVVDGAIPQAFGEVTLNVRWNDLGQAERLCQNAPLIQPRRQVRGDTRGEGDHFQSSCGGQGSSPDKVYKLQIRRRSFVRISSEQQDWDGVLHLRRDCLDPMTELGCNDDAGDSTHSMIETILEPGTYYVFVDGYGSNSAGLFTLDVEVRNP